MKHAKSAKPNTVLRLIVCIAVCAVLVCGAVWGTSLLTNRAPATDAPITTTTTTQAKQAVTKQTSATILATGDLLMHIPVVNTGRTADGYNYDSIFKYIKDDVTAADFAVANLETTFAGTEDGRAYSGYPRFNCPDPLADAAKTAGFDMLLTANNHCNDTGSLGITRTLSVVKDSGLLTLGTQENATDPKYTVQEINGIRIGMVCYTYGTINDSTGQKAVNGLSINKTLTDHVNVFDYNKLDTFYTEMKQHITAMETDGAEAVVLFIHWGNEYQTKHNNAQTKIAQAMCDLGVDVIVGGHPHVVQDVELLTSTTEPSHKTLCAYSLGNAVSNQRRTRMNLKTGHTEDGALFTFTFTKYTNGEVYLEESNIIPTWVYIRSGTSKSYDILPLNKEVADWKTALDLGDTSLALAEESYERTAALVDEGLAAANAVLTNDRTAREAIFAETFI